MGIAGTNVVDCAWNVTAHAQKPDFVFRRNGRVHLSRRRRQFSRLLAAELCASAVVMLDTPCSEVVWRVLATHSIRQFPLHFPSRASLCAITFQLESTSWQCDIPEVVGLRSGLPVKRPSQLLGSQEGAITWWELQNVYINSTLQIHYIQTQPVDYNRIFSVI